MAYERQNFKDGEVLMASHLNHIEDGVKAADTWCHETAIVCSASGETISIADASNNPLRGLILHGKTTQNGTPTPDTPIDLVSAGDEGSVDVKVYGKNLHDMGDWVKQGCATIAEDGSYHINTLAMYNTYGRPENNKFLYIAENGNVPITCTVTYKKDSTEVTGSCFGLLFVYTDGTSVGDSVYGIISDGVSQWETKKMSSNPNKTLVGVRFGWCTYPSWVKEFQIEIGTTTTEYEPYKEPQTLTISTPNGLPGIPVSTGGNYTDSNGQQWVCDEIDFAKGVYVQRVKLVVLDDSLDYGWLTAGAHSNGNKYASMVFTDMKQSSAILCNCYESTGWSNLPGKTYGSGTALVMVDNRFTDRATAIATITEMKPKFLYVLANPIETALSAEELAAYAALHTNRPNTTVCTDSNAGVKMEYVADTKTYIDNKFTELAAAIVANA